MDRNLKEEGSVVGVSPFQSRAALTKHCMETRKFISIISCRWAVYILTYLFACPCFAGNVPADFSGNWIINYDCQKGQATCNVESGDYFALYGITQVHSQICAYHIATGDLQRRIDEGDIAGIGPSVYGLVSGNVAVVTFVSALTGEKGKARVTLAKGNLIWDVLTPLKGESWFPDHAVLSRAPSDQKYPTANCSQLRSGN